MNPKWLLLLLLPFTGSAQTDGLVFDTRYYEAEDRWVVFPKAAGDSTYSYGFIYLDLQAGFTFDLASIFKVAPDGKFVSLPKPFPASVKYRLEPDTKLVALLPEEKRVALGLPQTPEWLNNYKPDSGGRVASLVLHGVHYNEVGASENAILFLLAAREADPKAKGLHFELGFAYNATGEFDKAIAILLEGLELKPDNALYYKELGFAYMKLGRIAEAEQAYLKGMSLTQDSLVKGEMAVNMAQSYYYLKNREKFDEWAAKTLTYSGKGSRFAGLIADYRHHWDR